MAYSTGIIEAPRANPEQDAAQDGRFGLDSAGYAPAKTVWARGDVGKGKAAMNAGALMCMVWLW